VPQTRTLRNQQKLLEKTLIALSQRVKNLNTHVIVMVTTASKQEAENMAQQLLKERLIACANITGPVSSIFHWAEKLEKAEEYIVFMKSRKDLFEKLTETVKAIHSYEVPEIIALPIVDGSKPYLDWLDSCLAGQKKS
jgi:periplasmic divalent cation tolerance protein